LEPCHAYGSFWQAQSRVHQWNSSQASSYFSTPSSMGTLQEYGALMAPQRILPIA